MIPTEKNKQTMKDINNILADFSIGEAYLMLHFLANYYQTLMTKEFIHLKEQQ